MLIKFECNVKSSTEWKCRQHLSNILVLQPYLNKGLPQVVGDASLKTSWLSLTLNSYVIQPCTFDLSL